MDGTRIQALAYRGYAISARQVGLPHQLYRPSGVSTPIAPGNLVTTLPAAMSPDDYRFRRAGDYAHPTWSALVDGSQIAVGDYLVGADQWFVSSMDALLPISVVRCNRVISVFRPSFSRQYGRVHGVDGDTIAAETPVMTSWPASLLQGTKGEKSDTGIPDAGRNPWYVVLMPAVPGVDILTDDIATDDHGRRYQISSAELTDRGWRLSVALAAA